MAKKKEEKLEAVKSGEHNHVIHTLPMVEVLRFVDETVHAVTATEYGYMPEILEYVFRSNVFERYGGIVMPDDVEETYALLYSDAYYALLEKINTAQVNAILESIEKKIDHLLALKEATAEDQMKQMMVKINELLAIFESLTKDVNADDVQKLISALAASGSFDEKKIVEAYLDAKKES